IDQFAEAEGRMKWAPNKKLHFEVAVIKAIQSLNQVTLNEVIENLNALRDGKNVPTKKSSSVAAAVAPASQKIAAGTAASTPSRVAEKPADDYGAKSSDSNVDPAKIWQEVNAKIPAKGFLRTLVDSLTVLGAEGRHFLLGYPPGEKSAIETLATTSNRRQLETLLKEVSGRDWSVKLSAKEGLASKSARREPAREAEEFKDDPLIQEALEMFKGEIKS
ncbi:MAG: hypothetical protein M3R29_02115, partial [Verrucomicrobiota bacterium]|nr:hypothetical protein [Verrucomicrobiota bacterium]